MGVTLQQAEKILRKDQIFAQLGFSMMIARLKKTYARNPSPEILQSCADEINAFLDKFKSSMGGDYAVITKL